MLTEQAKKIVETIDEKMQEAVLFLEEDLKTYRVGKANPSIFKNVMVNYYGTMTPIGQVSSISSLTALVARSWSGVSSYMKEDSSSSWR